MSPGRLLTVNGSVEDVPAEQLEGSMQGAELRPTTWWQAEIPESCKHS
jgi:hypothetical protein